MQVVIVVFKLHCSTFERVVSKESIATVFALNHNALFQELSSTDHSVSIERLFVFETSNSVQFFEGSVMCAQIWILSAFLKGVAILFAAQTAFVLVYTIVFVGESVVFLVIFGFMRRKFATHCVLIGLTTTPPHFT